MFVSPSRGYELVWFELALLAGTGLRRFSSRLGTRRAAAPPVRSKLASDKVASYGHRLCRIRRPALPGHSSLERYPPPVDAERFRKPLSATFWLTSPPTSSRFGFVHFPPQLGKQQMGVTANF